MAFLGEETRPPLSLRRPETIEAFTTKWQNPQLRSLPQNFTYPVMQMDYERAQRGAQPLSERETVIAIRAIAGERGQDPEGGGVGGFIGNIGDDARSIASSFIKLPFMAWNELQELPEAPGEVAEGLTKLTSGEIREGVAQIAQAPGVRMAPGAFIAESLATDPSQLVEHPLMTLLDVAPFASKAVSGVPRVASKIEATGQAPLRAAASELMGRPAGNLVERFTGRRPAAFLDKWGIGPGVGRVASLVNKATRELKQQTELMARENREMFIEAGLDTPEKVEAFSEKVASGDPQLLATLTPAERQLREQIRERNLTIEDQDPDRWIDIDGERYPATAEQGKLLDIQTRKLGKDRYKPEAFEELTRLITKDEPLAAEAADATSRLRRRGYSDITEVRDRVLADVNENPLSSAQYGDLLTRGFDRTRIEDLTADIMHNALRSSDASLAKNARKALDRLRALGDLGSGADAYKAVYGMAKMLRPEQAVGLLDEFGLVGRFPQPNVYNKALREIDDFVTKTSREGGNLQTALRYIEEGKYDRAGKRLGAAASQFERLYRRNPGLAANAATLERWLNDAEALKDFHAQSRGLGAQRRLAGRREDYTKRVAEIQESQKKLQETYAESPPPRWMPNVEERFRKRMKALAISRNTQVTEEALQAVMKNVDEELYDLVGISREEMQATWKEVSGEWTTLKAQGYDPVLLHPVDPTQITSVRYPRVFPDKMSSPSQWKTRGMDASPYIKDFEVALNHKGLEILNRNMTARVIEEVKQLFGKTRQELSELYAPRLARLSPRPGMNMRGILESEMAKEWVKWDEMEIVPMKKARAGIEAGDDIYIPKWTADTLKKMYPDQKAGISAAWDKAGQVFRLSILPFSPRWHIYNFVGGALMLGARTGPGVLGTASEALAMVKATRDGLIDGAMPTGLARGAGALPEELASVEMARANTAGRWFNEAISDPNSPIARTKEGVSNFTNKLFDINSFVDDMYRSMAFIYGRDKNLKAGLADDVANMRGIEIANKVLQNWDSMRPIERSLLRGLFPFYGWMKHILTYAVTLPLDHPLRMSIMSNFARNEINDFPLSQRIFNMLFLGSPDEKGNVTAIPITGLNPFSDVANYTSLSGFVSQLNPVIGGFMEATGMDPITGKAELYPETEYDPTTGRLQPRTKSPIMSILTSLVPQAEGVGAVADQLLGTGTASTDLQRLRVEDPEMYRTRIASTFGIPPLPRTINVGEEAAKMELSKSRAARDAFLTGLRTGDWTDAAKYPENRPLLENIDELLASGALDAFLIGQ